MNDTACQKTKLKAVYIDFIPEGNIGVRNKISYQIEALESLGVSVIHANYSNGFGNHPLN